MRIEVECDTPEGGDAVPRRFYLGKKPVEVTEIIDRWLDPSHSYFKLRDDDGAVYILRYDREADFWELIMFDSGKRQETRLSSS